MNAASLGRPSTNPEFRLTLFACVALAFVSSWASARQCGPGWQPVESGWRANGAITSSTWWDPDGDGPEPERLVVHQTNRNSTYAAMPLVWWDGSTWHRVGSTLIASNALTTYQGSLVSAALTSVFRLENGRWRSIGTSNYSVNAAVTYSGSLYVAGSFSAIGRTVANGIARWTGSTWEPLGTGVNGRVDALFEFNGRLIVAGTFSSAGGSPASRIAAWDGSSWSPLGDGLNNSVTTLCAYQGKLVAGGSFSGSGATTAMALAAWDGSSWAPIGGGVTGVVTKVASNGPDLYVAGPSAFGGVPAKKLAKWDGAAWTPLDLANDATIVLLEPRGNDLFVGGSMSNIGPDFASGLVQRIGDQWRGVGLQAQGPGRAIEKLSSGVYAAFNAISPSPPNARVVRWDGLRWTDCFAPLKGSILAISEFNGDVVIGGSFSSPTPPGLLRWNGTAWVPLSADLRGTVNALTIYRGELIALGAFNVTGGIEGLARFDGTTWRALGVNRPLGSWKPTANNFVNLIVFEDRLYVPGDFWAGSGAVGNRFASWDGNAWTDLGDLRISLAQSVAAYQGSLYVGTELSEVYRRDGSLWTRVGVFFGGSDGSAGGLRGIRATDRGLLAFGNFGSPGQNIARWDGTAWRRFESTPTGRVQAAVQDGDELFAVGDINSVGTFPADGWGVWTFTGAPTIGTQPSSAAAATNDDVALSIRIPDGYRDITAQWFHNGEPVRDGAAGAALGGGFVRGARTTIAQSDSTQDISLVIQRARYTDAGAYTVSVANECGEATSIPATLAVNCAADFNGDGFLSFEDFDAFIAAFEVGQSSSDVNADAFLSFEDVDAFVAAFEEGC
ncbi:MAG: GC-type dockerin domain-anchored protein [Planctomycetota bacterium]|nr:GC-type dockerin domain-anchored protein [Planctomycetota bacterium]